MCPKRSICALLLFIQLINFVGFIIAIEIYCVLMQNLAQQFLQQQQQQKRKTLTFNQKQHFDEGVKLLLDRWYILNLAIEMRWGNVEPTIKKEILYENIIDLFQNRKDLDEIDLEDFFDEFFQIEFQIQAEDGSLGEVARDLISMYFECSEENFSRIDHLKSYQPFPINKNNQLNQNDEDEESEGEGDDDEGGEAMEVIEEEEGEEEKEKNQEIKQNKNTPVIDEDGFQLVQRKRK
eukprot:TRINITY_DN4687_c1_g1_i1.p1 TRINITY_DN4687_c1_g1~~TRINITY_DN4687_c1_g1_i1.p1  ORF type:complete len:236 (-),score=62.88 TRINITY_DN4687_c1_g1_i1:285-992(-)